MAWANAKVDDEDSQIESMRDSTIRDSVFIMDLLNTIRPGVVNWELVHGIESPEDRLHNARYVLSVACKLGCHVYLLPEDIVEVNRKMVLTLFGTSSTFLCRVQDDVTNPLSIPPTFSSFQPHS